MRPSSFNLEHITSCCEIVRDLVLSDVPRQIGYEDSPATCAEEKYFNM